MNKNIFLKIIIFTSFVSLLISCGKNVESGTSHSKNAYDAKVCCTDIQEGGKISDESVYQVGSLWRDEYGKKVRLADLRGKVQVISMIFTSCGYACPLIVNNLKQIESKISEKYKDKINFLLVSIDPERDTPVKLLEYARNKDLDLTRWKLLTGTEVDIRELAALLGFQYSKNADGNFTHSNMITILNKSGEIVYQHNGLSGDISDVIERLN